MDAITDVAKRRWERDDPSRMVVPKGAAVMPRPDVHYFVARSASGFLRRRFEHAQGVRVPSRPMGGSLSQFVSEGHAVARWAGGVSFLMLDDERSPDPLCDAYGPHIALADGTPVYPGWWLLRTDSASLPTTDVLVLTPQKLARDWEADTALTGRMMAAEALRRAYAGWELTDGIEALVAGFLREWR